MRQTQGGHLTPANGTIVTIKRTHFFFTGNKRRFVKVPHLLVRFTLRFTSLRYGSSSLVRPTLCNQKFFTTALFVQPQCSYRRCICCSTWHLCVLCLYAAEAYLCADHVRFVHSYTLPYEWVGGCVSVRPPSTIPRSHVARVSSG